MEHRHDSCIHADHGWRIAGGGDPASVAIVCALRHPARVVPGSMKAERLAAVVKVPEISLDRQQRFAILAASEGRPVA
ncbi:hypothetical protein [Mesorhizobium sp. WSM3626]|uniref:hypothetical protein n=1 Tax=Mesorhizobium sp. WSM3626 TaxID=1040987 RepID=UPI000484ABD1|nr:hypothetical protein [Mesorhizobium sp. WSM3626]